MEDELIASNFDGFLTDQKMSTILEISQKADEQWMQCAVLPIALPPFRAISELAIQLLEF